jgi:hypothetical protein
MPTFHTLDEAIKEFERLSKIDSIDDGFIRWSTSEGDKILHLPPMLDFLSLVWESAQEATKRELVEKVENLQFKMDIKYYLPMVKAWQGGYDVPFDDGFKICKKDIVNLINK